MLAMVVMEIPSLEVQHSAHSQTLSETLYYMLLSVLCITDSIMSQSGKKLVWIKTKVF